VATLGAGRVRTLAVEIPAGAMKDLDGIGNAIYAAVDAGAQIVSVSFAMDCGPACNTTYLGNRPDAAVLRALALAKERSATVLFAAGNDNWSLDDGGRYFAGCESPDALCVGGIFRDKKRWIAYPASGGSNWGTAVQLWGPAHQVWVNPDGGKRHSHFKDGTSLATPFLAGMLALVEVSTGTRLTVDAVRGHLAELKIPSDDDKVKPGLLNPYELIRKLGAVAPDAFENGDSTPSKTLPGPNDLLTIHTEDKGDAFEVASTQCEIVTAEVDYLRDDKRGTLLLALSPAGGRRIIASVPTAPNDALTVTASACAGSSIIEVSRDENATNGDSFTTGYSLNIRREPVVCGAGCPQKDVDSKGSRFGGIDRHEPPDPCPRGVPREDCPRLREPPVPVDDGKRPVAPTAPSGRPPGKTTPAPSAVPPKSAAPTRKDAAR
jgi:hypothetical protein